MINNDRNPDFYPFEGEFMITLPFPILFPAAIALLLLLVPGDSWRRLIVKAGALIIGIASLYLLFITPEAGPEFFPVAFEPVSNLMFLAEMVIAAFLIYLGVKYKKYLAILLVIAQAALLVYYESMGLTRIHTVPNLFIDQFSLIMALIIGIIGSLICVYALGYMATYQEHHPEVKDRRRTFFFLMFFFLSSMFGLVFSDYLPWVFFFWELTTLCSFLLIWVS